MDNPGQQQVFSSSGPRHLPNATAVLVLGIISIVSFCCYGVVGLICGIIALTLASKDQRLYNSEPGQYTLSSYNNLKTGRICAIIGLSLSALYIIFLVIFLATFGLVALSDPSSILRQYQ